MQRNHKQRRTKKCRDKGGPWGVKGTGRNSGVRGQIRLQLEERKRNG